MQQYTSFKYTLSGYLILYMFNNLLGICLMWECYLAELYYVQSPSAFSPAEHDTSLSLRLHKVYHVGRCLNILWSWILLPSHCSAVCQTSGETIESSVAECLQFLSCWDFRGLHTFTCRVEPLHTRKNLWANKWIKYKLLLWHWCPAILNLQIHHICFNNKVISSSYVLIYLNFIPRLSMSKWTNSKWRTIKSISNNP